MNRFGKGGLELLRAFAIWSLSFGLYLWLGGASLRLVWFVCSVLLAYGILLRVLGISQIKIRRAFVPSVVQAGGQAELQVEMSWRCWLPIPWLLVTDRIGERITRKVLFPGWRRKLSYTSVLTDMPRGEWADIDSEIIWGDLFGWFRVRRILPGQAGLTVLPRPMSISVQDFAVYGDEMRVMTDVVTADRRAEYPGAGVRDYVPGDPLNRIHWKNSARTGKLQTKIPTSGYGSNTGIWLYSGNDGYPAPSTSDQKTAFELAVSASAGLAYYYESGDITYSLYTTAEEAAGMGGPSSRARTGKHRYDEALKSLAAVHLSDPLILTDLDAYSGPGRAPSSLIIVTGAFSGALVRVACSFQSAGRNVTICCTSSEQHPSSEQIRHKRDGNRERVNRFLELGGRLLVLNAERGVFERGYPTETHQGSGGEESERTAEQQKLAY